MEEVVVGLAGDDLAGPANAHDDGGGVGFIHDGDETFGGGQFGFGVGEEVAESGVVAAEGVAAGLEGGGVDVGVGVYEHGGDIIQGWGG